MRLIERSEDREPAPQAACRDPKDQKFLELAFEADAGTIAAMKTSWCSTLGMAFEFCVQRSLWSGWATRAEASVRAERRT